MSEPRERTTPRRGGRTFDLPEDPGGARQARPTIYGTHHVVSSSNQHASIAGLLMFERGGNAIDAGVAAGFAMNVVAPWATNLGGVAPLLVFQPGMSSPVSIDGLGWASRHATRQAHIRRYGDDIPAGISQTVVPAAPDAWFTALERFGRLSLREVLAPAIALADGFPVYPTMAAYIRREADYLRAWPTSAAVFLPGGQPPQVGDVFVQSDLAALLRRFVSVEQANAGLGRAAAIRAVRNDFYRGEPARAIGDFVQREGGFLDYEDIASYSVTEEPAVHSTYRGFDVYTCGAWCQGPVLPMTLNIVEPHDLVSLGHNSTAYIHLLTEALKLAFADREAFIGDPRHVDVPISGLLSKGYGKTQSRRIRLDRAELGMPSPGDPWAAEGRTAPPRRGSPDVDARPAVTLSDTTYVCAVDAEGNAFSATPSDAYNSPLVPGLGIIASHRGLQFWLHPDHPSVIAPRKRPRLTPSPAMLLRQGRAQMAFGTPGGDAQSQSMLQFLCNVLDFGLDIQQAIEAPRFRTWSHPSSFWPHRARPDVLTVEEGVEPETLRALDGLGHRVEQWPKWTPQAAGVCAIRISEKGVLDGGADPRRDSYAVGR